LEVSPGGRGSLRKTLKAAPRVFLIGLWGTLNNKAKKPTVDEIHPQDIQISIVAAFRGLDDPVSDIVDQE